MKGIRIGKVGAAKAIKDNDVHLIGMACMFIATKYVTDDHIPLQFMVTDVYKRPHPNLKYK